MFSLNSLNSDFWICADTAEASEEQRLPFQGVVVIIRQQF